MRATRSRVVWSAHIWELGLWVDELGAESTATAVAFFDHEHRLQGFQVVADAPLRYAASTLLREALADPINGVPRRPTVIRTPSAALAEALATDDDFPAVEVGPVPGAESARRQVEADLASFWSERPIGSLQSLRPEGASDDDLRSFYEAAAAFTSANLWSCVENLPLPFSLTCLEADLDDAVLALHVPETHPYALTLAESVAALQAAGDPFFDEDGDHDDSDEVEDEDDDDEDDDDDDDEDGGEKADPAWRPLLGLMTRPPDALAERLQQEVEAAGWPLDARGHLATAIFEAEPGRPRVADLDQHHRLEVVMRALLGLSGLGVRLREASAGPDAPIDVAVPVRTARGVFEVRVCCPARALRRRYEQADRGDFSWLDAREPRADRHAAALYRLWLVEPFAARRERWPEQADYLVEFTLFSLRRRLDEVSAKDLAPLFQTELALALEDPFRGTAAQVGAELRAFFELTHERTGWPNLPDLIAAVAATFPAD